MNTTEQLTHIRSKCVKAVPSILDLKFGCRIITSRDHICIVERKDEFQVITLGEDGNKRVVGLKKIKEVIGRPIQLSDVLLAINNTGPVLYGITSGGVFAKIGVTGTPKYNMYLEEAYWNNLDDNLDHQSPEVLQFLYELLHD